MIIDSQTKDLNHLLEPPSPALWISERDCVNCFPLDPLEPRGSAGYERSEVLLRQAVTLLMGVISE